MTREKMAEVVSVSIRAPVKDATTHLYGIWTAKSVSIRAPVKDATAEVS